ARLGGDVAAAAIVTTPADLPDMVPPVGGVMGGDWTDIANAIHETGWSESWLRKHRHKLGVRLFGVWYFHRPTLAKFPKPAPIYGRTAACQIVPNRAGDKA